MTTDMMAYQSLRKLDEKAWLTFDQDKPNLLIVRPIYGYKSTPQDIQEIRELLGAAGIKKEALYSPPDEPYRMAIMGFDAIRALADKGALILPPGNVDAFIYNPSRTELVNHSHFPPAHEQEERTALKLKANLQEQQAIRVLGSSGCYFQGNGIVPRRDAAQPELNARLSQQIAGAMKDAGIPDFAYTLSHQGKTATHADEKRKMIASGDSFMVNMRDEQGGVVASRLAELFIKHKGKIHPPSSSTEHNDIVSATVAEIQPRTFGASRG